MKRRRFIFWMILLALFLFAGGGMIHAYQHLQERLMEYMGTEDSNTELDWKRLRYFSEDGRRGLSVSDVFSYNKITGDSIFSADRVVLYSNSEFKDIRSGEMLGIYIENPVMHLRDSRLESDDTLPQGDVFSFKELPSLYMRNLSIVNHSQGAGIRRIEGIDIKAENRDGLYDFRLRYADSLRESEFVVAALFSGSSENLRIDSAFVEYNNCRLVNFNLVLNSHKRAEPDYEYHICNNISGENLLPVKGLTEDSYLAFDVHKRHWDGGVSGNSTAHICLKTADSLQLSVEHGGRLTSVSDSSFSIVGMQSPHGNCSYRFEKDSGKSGMQWSQKYIGNVQEEMVISDSIRFKFGINADFSQSGDLIRHVKNGYISDQAEFIYGNRVFSLSHNCSRQDNFIQIKSLDSLFSAKFEFRHFLSEILSGQGVYVHSHLYAENVTIPVGEPGNSNFWKRQPKKNQETPEWLLKSDLAMDMLVDSLKSDKRLIGEDMKFNITYHDQQLDMQSGLGLYGDAEGYVRAGFTSAGGDFSGAIESDGLLITNQKELPLIAGSLDLVSDTALIQPFSIPFTYRNESFRIEPSAVRSNEFMMMVSGTVNRDKQSLKLGITASAGKFKGAAALILARKSENTKGLKTILLDVERQHGKTNIKTEVLEDEFH